MLLRHGRPAERPYFSIDGRAPVVEEADALAGQMASRSRRNQFRREPAVHGRERMGGAMADRKPLAEPAPPASTDEGDIVREPFGGLRSASVSALRNRRSFRAAEIDPACFAAAQRLADAEERIEHAVRRAGLLRFRGGRDGPNRDARLPCLRRFSLAPSNGAVKTSRKNLRRCGAAFRCVAAKAASAARASAGERNLARGFKNCIEDGKSRKARNGAIEEAVATVVGR